MPQTKHQKVNRTGANDVMKLESISFKVEDKTDPNTGKPERVENFFPVTCSANTIAYTCDKQLTLSVSKISTLSFGSGLSMTASFGVKTSVEAGGRQTKKLDFDIKFFNKGKKKSFLRQNLLEETKINFVR